MGVNSKGEMFDPSEEEVLLTTDDVELMHDNVLRGIEHYENIKDNGTSPADLDDDPVNPAHYMSYYKDGIDCISAMKHAFGNEAVVDFCICNAFKYIWRHMSKNGMQDIEKAIWYLNKYIELNK